MSFRNVLDQFRTRFAQQGIFLLHSGESIRRVVAECRVPARAAAYVISAVGCNPEVIYIGKAGTVRTDGTWKDQMLSRRLCNRQGGMSRQDFFQKMLAETGASELRFEWFVTQAERMILPVLAEAELLQSFYDETGKLPRYNECA
jgi:hypothetical protein